MVNGLVSLFGGENWMKNFYERDFVDFSFRIGIMTVWPFWSVELQSTKRIVQQHFVHTLNPNRDQYTPNRPRQCWSRFHRFQLTKTYRYREVRLQALGEVSHPQRKQISYWWIVAFCFLWNTKRYQQHAGAAMWIMTIDVGVRYGFKMAFVDGWCQHTCRCFWTTRAFTSWTSKHFMGNRTPIITSPPDGILSLADYYKNSTSDKYLSAILHYISASCYCREFPKTRATKWAEKYSSLFGNPGLWKPYGTRLFHWWYSFACSAFEGAASFVNGKYTGWGVRLGVSSRITVNFGD